MRLAKENTRKEELGVKVGAYRYKLVRMCEERLAKELYFRRAR